MSKLYLFTQKNCARCPTYKVTLTEANIDFVEVDIYSNKFDSMQLDLLDNNIFIIFTPSLVLEEDNRKMRLIKLEEIVRW